MRKIRAVFGRESQTQIRIEARHREPTPSAFQAAAGRTRPPACRRPLPTAGLPPAAQVALKSAGGRVGSPPDGSAVRPRAWSVRACVLRACVTEFDCAAAAAAAPDGRFASGRRSRRWHVFEGWLPLKKYEENTRTAVNHKSQPFKQA